MVKLQKVARPGTGYRTSFGKTAIISPARWGYPD